MYNIHSINKNKNTRKTEEKIFMYCCCLRIVGDAVLCWSLLYTIKGSNPYVVSNFFQFKAKKLRRKWNYSSEFGSERIRVDQMHE